MDRDQLKQQLMTMRRSLEAPWAAAKAAGDTAEMERREGIAAQIDELRIDLAMMGLAELATEVTHIRAKIDGHAANLDNLQGGVLSQIKQAIEDIFAQTAEEEVSAPPVANPTLDAPVVAAPPPPPPAPPAPAVAGAAAAAPPRSEERRGGKK